MILLFFFWLFTAASNTIYPVTRFGESLLTALYLFLHMLGRHGAAVYVRNGRIKAYVEELQQSRPGVILVDYNSAVAVERTVLPPGLLRLLMGLFRGLAETIGFSSPPVRIRGAGLVFTLPDERIYGTNDLESQPVALDDGHWMNRILGVIDLRNQFRISIRQPHPLSKRLGTSVSAYTRDGIEVQTNINVLATLGHEVVPFFPVNVTYVGNRSPRNLRVVRFRNMPGHVNAYQVESIADELDLADRLEIHRRWQTISSWVPYGIPPPPPAIPIFNPGRVFAAVFARARHHAGLNGADEIIPCFDLPVHVAIDFFREIISHYNYDEIYTPDASGNLRINQIRAQFATVVRNSGVLAWRPVFHRRGDDLVEGQMYSATSLLTVPPAGAMVLQGPQVLRDRGIRIITAGFGNLEVDERIHKQRLDHWRAVWDRETEILEAGLEWDSARVHTQARIQAQEEFVNKLSQIYQSNGNSREILALRVLQALEAAAVDPKTRQLLPEDTFSMLRSIHDWLLPQDMGYGNGQ